MLQHYDIDLKTSHIDCNPVARKRKCDDKNSSSPCLTSPSFSTDPSVLALFKFSTITASSQSFQSTIRGWAEYTARTFGGHRKRSERKRHGFSRDATPPNFDCACLFRRSLTLFLIARRPLAVVQYLFVRVDFRVINLHWIYLVKIYQLLQLSPLGAANLFAKEFKKRGKISDSREHHFWAPLELIRFAEESKARWRKILLLLVMMRGVFGHKFDFRGISLLILNCRLHYHPLLISLKVLNRENKTKMK